MEAVSTPPPRFRPEIEGLRTIAFLLVAVFHVWLGRVSGGVDVFFMVAGLLITTTLLGHVRRWGRIRIGTYFARLARRLLPTAAVVLLAVAVLTWWLLPRSLWEQTFEQVVAAGTYWENWYLAFNAVDYLATDETRSPVQHFWAMSIQGQFYVVWLVLFLGATAVARRFARSPERVVAWLLAAVFVVSFSWSVYDTDLEQQFAYFSTFTRLWEFALGGLLALALPLLRVPRWVSTAIGWIGLATLLSVGILLPVADLFPGYVALIPTLAAAAIIVSGNVPNPFGVARLLGSRPFVAFGGLGYGVYLWHWPILIFVLHVRASERAGPLTGAAIIGLAIGLSWVTKVALERRLARFAGVERRGRSAVALAAACALLVLPIGAGVSTVGVIRHSAAVAAEQRSTLLSDPCYGAAAIETGLAACSSSFDGQYFPVAGPSADSAEIFDGDCATDAVRAELKVCTWGVEDADTRIALIGNSHAAVWFPAYRRIAEIYGWRLDTFFKHSCTFNTAERRTDDERSARTCDEWNDTLADYLAGHEPYDYVLMSAIAQNSEFLDEAGQVDFHAGVDGYRDVWAPLIAQGDEILAIRDYPRSDDVVLACAINDPTAECARSESEARVSADQEVLAVAADGQPGVHLIDMSEWFCVDGACPAVIGNVYVYRDVAHFTNSYGETLTPHLIDKLVDIPGFPPAPSDWTRAG